MASTKIITQPVDEPIETDEAQAYMELGDDVDGELITSLIQAARIDIENRTGRAFINRTLQTTLDRTIRDQFPLPEGWVEGPDIIYCADYVELPVGPLSEITEVRWFDEDNQPHIFASDNYYADTAADPGRLVLNRGRSWPDGMRRQSALQITYIAGDGEYATDVDEAVRLAIRMHVAHAYENRGGNADTPEPAAIARLIAPYRTIRV